MKKKLLICFFAIVLGFIQINVAEASTCEYSLEEHLGTGSGSIIINVDEVKEEQSDGQETRIAVSSSYNGGTLYSFDGDKDFYIGSNIFENTNQCLTNILVCKSGGIVGGRLGVFGSTMDPQTININGVDTFDTSHDKYGMLSQIWRSVTSKSVDCRIYPITRKDRKEVTDEYFEQNKENFISYCAKFNEMLVDVAKSYVSYGDCEKNSTDNSKISICRSKALSEVNRKIDILKDTCRNIVSNQNYSVEDGCIQSCLNEYEALKLLKDSYIETNNLKDTCSFSNRLAIWIRNIFNWIKYIIPVAVIIFGIIDFIRAIASDKDDEMKKAQARFIKRLIAAALTFIIPLIIVFVLDKMGFTVNGCGIIDL